MNCECMCDLVIDNLSLYINFEGCKNVSTVKFNFRRWLSQYGIDTFKLKIIFSYPVRSELVKYGLYDSLMNLRYIESLSGTQLNCMEGLLDIDDAYDRQYKATCGTRSIAVFIGPLEGEYLKQYNRYVSELKVPIIHIMPDKEAVETWVGKSDRDYNNYLDNSN